MDPATVAGGSATALSPLELARRRRQLVEEEIARVARSAAKAGVGMEVRDASQQHDPAADADLLHLRSIVERPECCAAPLCAEEALHPSPWCVVHLASDPRQRLFKTEADGAVLKLREEEEECV